MPKSMHVIWWDNKLGPSVGRSYPEEIVLTTEEAVVIFMGHGANMESEIGYTKLKRGLVVSYLDSPICIAVVIKDDEDTAIIERNLMRLVPHLNFNTEDWETEIRRAYNTLNELIQETTGDELLTNPNVKTLITDLIEGRIEKIRPKSILKSIIRYPEASNYLGNDEEEVARMLEDLEKEGVLQRKTYGRVISCRQCGGHEVEFKLLCPKCESEKLHNVYNIYCPECSKQTHVVIVDELSEVICTACRDPVKVSELSVIDVESLCNECGAASADPKIVFFCALCEKRLKITDLLGGTGLAYEPTPEFTPEEK
ncbi:MAG: hypothetical protein GF411_13735 [Candidatus Lokiarchaeota archaeon]|nr:hypothetical protein [Candidatus Lokiarchaeota archaeon]